jgi:hypothetical protein
MLNDGKISINIIMNNDMFWQMLQQRARLDAFDSNSSRMGCFMHRNLPAIDNSEALLENHYEILSRKTSVFTVRWQGEIHGALSSKRISKQVNTELL